MVAPGVAKAHNIAAVGGYRMLRRLGAGTFGEVWHAEAPGGVDVAVKLILRPLGTSHGERELNALEAIKHLRHAFLLQTHSFWAQEDDRLIIVMELADCSLRDRLKACIAAGQSGIPPQELIGYLRESCQVLDYLHGKRVLHLDIKPDNILLLEGHVKLADLGLARMLEDQRSFAATACGSPAYMAPEVWRGSARAQSDLYSLACTYAELRMNRLPITGDHMAQLMMAHAEGEPNLDPLPEAERQVLLRALAKNPADRFRKGQEFVQALEAALSPVLLLTPTREGGSTSTTPEPLDDTTGLSAADPFATRSDSGAVPTPEIPTLPPPRSPGRGRLAWVALVFVLLAAAAGLAYWRMPHGPLSPPPEGPSSPPPEVAFLPAGFSRDGDAPLVEVNGRKLYSRIVRVLDDGTSVPFLLMTQQGKDDPPPFYIMKHKVSNRVFRQYAAGHQKELAGSEWEKGAKVNMRDLGIDGERLDYPVFRVTVDQAHQCALWLGGELPTPEQWDKAGGCFAGQFGPFEGNTIEWHSDKEEFALAPLGPLPVGRAKRDKSFFGCCDMASNGWEWTCGMCQANSERGRVPFDHPEQNVDIAMRGMTYVNGKPYAFQGRKKEEPQGRKVADWDISFRVVIEVPAR